MLESNLNVRDEWFRLIIQTMNEAVCILDRSDVLVFVNKPLCTLSGYSEEELLGRRWADFFGQDIQSPLAEQVAGAESGSRHLFEMTWKAKDGRRCFVRVSPKVLRDEEGSIKGCFAVITDLTELKRGQNRTRELSVAVEQSPTGMLLTDATGTIEYVNAKFTELTGYSAQELVGHNPRVLQSGMTPDSVYSRLWDLVTAGREWYGEVLNRKKSGELYWANESIGPIKDARGEITHYLALQEDITARKFFEDTLRQTEAKYSTLVEYSLTGIYIVRDGNLVYTNRKFADIFAYAPDELVGLAMDRLIPAAGEPEESGQQSFPHWLKEERRKIARDVKGRRKDGEAIWLHRSETAIEYEGAPATLGNLIDITQEIRMQETIAESGEQLRILSERLLHVQEKERARIALELHDGIGQYLSAIKFSLQNLEQLIRTGTIEPVSESYSRVYPMLQEAIDEVRRLAMDLRPSTLDDLGILATIQWFCRNFQQVFSHVHICREFQAEEKDVPIVLKIVIYRVLQEAMNNIAKHSKADRVTIGLAKTDRELVFSVEDNGCGFNLPMHRANEEAERGFGLIGMRERVNLSGGRFTIESWPGTGTSICAFWPLSALRRRESVGDRPSW